MGWSGVVGGAGSAAAGRAAAGVTGGGEGDGVGRREMQGDLRQTAAGMVAATGGTGDGIGLRDGHALFKGVTAVVTDVIVEGHG